MCVAFQRSTAFELRQAKTRRFLSENVHSPVNITISHGHCDKVCDVMICFSQSTDRRDFIDGQKQRLWLKFSLDDVDNSTSRDDGSSASMTSVEQQPSLVTRDDLEHDVQLMTQISQLSQQLVTSQEHLVEVVERVTTKVNEQLTSLEERHKTSSEAHQLTLVAHSNK